MFRCQNFPPPGRFPSFLSETTVIYEEEDKLSTLTGKVPVTRLGLPLGYGFPGMIPQEEIIATGALQPSLHT